MLHIVRSLAVKGHHIVNAAVLLVVAAVTEKFISVCGIVEELLFAECLISGRIEPEDSGVKDNAFVGFFVNIEVIVHKSVKSAVFIVTELVPARDYLFGEYVFAFIFEIHINTSSESNWEKPIKV